jgi:low temperature requirement protein LtrA
MVAGIIFSALGIEQTLAHVGDPLGTIPAVALRGGVALYLLVHLQDRFWAMCCSAAYESAERTTRSLVNTHDASLSITQKVS